MERPMVVSENQRVLVWSSLLASDMRHRYYGYLASILGHRARVTQALATLLMSGATIGFLTATGEIATLLVPFAGFAGAGLSAWLAFGQVSERAIQSAGLQRKSADLMREWEVLWDEIDSIGGKEAIRRWQQLDRESVASYEGASESLKFKEKLWDRCQDETIRLREAA